MKLNNTNRQYNLNIDSSVDMYQSFIFSIKSLMYSRNQKLKTRANVSKNIYKIIFDLNINIRLWAAYYLRINKFSTILLINSIVNEILFRWSKKKFTKQKSNKLHFLKSEFDRKLLNYNHIY